jgi:hypothetical protein
MICGIQLRTATVHHETHIVTLIPPLLSGYFHGFYFIFILFFSLMRHLAYATNSRVKAHGSWPECGSSVVCIYHKHTRRFLKFYQKTAFKHTKETE